MESLSSPPRYDAWGRVLNCLWCGAKLQRHTKAGRPRKFCTPTHKLQHKSFASKQATLVHELLDLTHSIALKTSTEFDQWKNFSR